MISRGEIGFVNALTSIKENKMDRSFIGNLNEVEIRHAKGVVCVRYVTEN